MTGRNLHALDAERLDAPRAAWSSPGAGYRDRLSAREAVVAERDRLGARLGDVRLVIAAIGLVVGWAVLFGRALPIGWLLPVVAAFAAVAIYHGVVRRAHARAERAAAFYRNGLARIEDRWEGTGSAGERFDDPHHVYASDLDLFGTGSLFELLSRARTRMGEDTLAAWLMTPAAPAVIRERHECLADLRDRLDLREDIAALGEHANVGVQPDSLLIWAETPNTLTRADLGVAAVALPVVALAGVLVWAVAGIATPFLLVLAVEALVLYRFKADIERVFHGTEAAFDDLGLFASLLLRLEAEPFEAEPLKRRIARLASHTLPASTTIDRLRTVVGLVEARRNPILGLLQVPLMYPVHAARAAERWRAEHGAAIRAWVEETGALEALLSVASYAYEHPDDPLPQIADGPARFDSQGLGHPLLPAAQCVRNDVHVGGTTRVLLVSGSNMSGKSTLLRTVGINTVLAMAGAPVRARRLTLTPLAIGASIRINDSLHEGSSRFYAEITRLRQLLELAGDDPALLFLLDELLQGTNSTDRRIGAEGVLEAFVRRGAIGLVSTHDLALTDIGRLAPGALHNVHFEDQIENGRMKFDFKLREGVVTKSNGLELMRSIGLDV